MRRGYPDIPPVRSERTEWMKVRNHARRILERVDRERQKYDPGGDVQYAAAQIMAIADAMLEQVERGVHHNPPLVVFGNPPHGRGTTQHNLRVGLVDVMSHDIHSVAYTHVEDGKDYKHDFEHPTDLIAAEQSDGRRVLVIRSPSGRDVWDIF